MKDIEVKKREWVKTAAIVFLAVMLVLTFFSNTIMNRSLPEVAAQYTSSATITARIRGSGKVVANEDFQVFAKHESTFLMAHVAVGDEVKPGDVLVTLSKESDEEMKELEDKLHKAEFELEKHLNSPTSPDNTYKMALISVQLMRTALTNAQEDRAKAQEELDKAINERDAIGFDEEAYRKAEADINKAEITLKRKEADFNDAERRLDEYIDMHGMKVEKPTYIVDIWGWADPDVYEGLLIRYNETTLEFTDAQRSLDRHLYDKKYAEQNLERWVKANDKVELADKALTEAKRNVVSSQQDLDIENSKLALEKELNSTLYGIQAREIETEIEELQKELDKLIEEGSATEITSKVSGVVTQILVKSGKQVKPEDLLMVIEIPDMGYTVNIKATANQSSRVRVGETAEVDRGWYSSGEPITAVLTSIRPDPDDPQGGRLLVFDVSGDALVSGTDLNITIAQQSENYGIVVPNSAVRSDTNGDFVLLVETRSSPLRNRYIATRVDVSILATDDTNTAINAAGLTGWDFVITTSSRPIEPGMQVRLVDNP